MSDFRLKVFRSVAKNLSFTKASQELFVSPPAITKHIQELEAAYQTRLFDRQGSRISLTESGNLLLEHCERILEDYKRLEYEMHLLHNEYTGGLKLGASTTIAQYVLPPLLASFIGKFRLSGNIWLVSFKISYLCLPLFYETRTTPSCHPSGCAYRQL